jgi:hypothetical protein
MYEIVNNDKEIYHKLVDLLELLSSCDVDFR